MRSLSIVFCLLAMLVQGAKAVPPVLNYAGQVAVNGEAFEGTGQFKFALVDADGKVTYWSNDGTSVGGLEPQGSLQVSVNGGLYSILLGNTAIQGMNALDPAIFQQHPNLRLRVWFNDGVNGFQQLSPDRPFASVPYAFSAGSAPIPQGSIDHSMLSIALRSDLNSSLKNITRNMLPASVLADLNRSITRDMLPASVLADLNKSITRSDLPSSVLADLNRIITKNNLGSDVLSDLNSSISLNRLSPEVLAALQVTPSISTQPFARYDWRTNSAVIEARGRGHELAYQWLKNGEAITGATTPVLEISNPVLDDNATYSVQLTNLVGQTISQTITLQDSSGLPLQEANATQVPRNGLVLWMDANDLNADGNADEIEIGNRIEYWADKITDKNASQSALNKQPLKVASGGVSFDGDDLLKISNLNVTAQHIIVVGSCNQIKGKLLHQGSLNLILIDETAGDFWEGSSNGHANKFNWRGAPVRVSSGPNKLTINEPFVLSITRGDTSGSYSELNLADSFDGEISEILFYDRFLQNNERDAVEQHLAQKWGITLYPEQLTAEQAAYDAALPVNEPEDGLQAYYKFEPVSVEPNKLWDYSGNGRHLNLNGFTGEPWTEGVEGYSLLFDGINDKATGSFDGKFRTISFWLNSDTNVDGMSSHVTVLQGWGPQLYNDKQYLNLNKRDINGSGHFQFHKESSTFIESSPDYNLTHSNWFHLALVASNDQGNDELSTLATYDFYINGNKIDVLRSNGNVGLLHTSRELNLGVASFHGRLDEFRAYNRALLPFEIKAFYDSIKKPLIDLNFEHNATVGSNFSLSLAADNGPTTYLAEGLPASLSLNTTTGQITGTLSQPGYHRVFVKAMNEHGTGSDTIAIIARPQTDQYGWPVDVPDGSDIPQNGMVLWLDANDIDADGEFDTNTDHLKLANWADKAGQDHNATQANADNQPEIRTGQISGKPNLNVLVFDGNQSLSFPTIAQGRTFFWVIKMHPDTSEHANFFSYNLTSLWGINGKPASYGKQALKLNGYSENVISNGNWKVNGNSVNPNDFLSFSPTTVSLVSSDLASSNLIGGHNIESLPGVLSDSFFSGNICEILIYDQVLLGNQIETVEKYLGSKWGISISHDTTPSPTGNPPTFSVTPANDSVTTAHLTEQILKYLKPEITAQPQATNVYSDSNHTFSVTAEGKYLTYQWKKNGTNLPGETNATLTITDANATHHDGNYSVVVSNDFGSVESGMIEFLVPTFAITKFPSLQLWLDSSDPSTITLNNGKVSNWNDKSTFENNASQSIEAKQPVFGQDENGTYVKFTSNYVSGEARNVSANNFLNISAISGKSIFFVIDHDGTKTSFVLGSRDNYKGYIFIGGDSYAISVDGYAAQPGPLDVGSWWYNGSFQATGGDLGTLGQISLNTPSLHSIIYQTDDPMYPFHRLGSFEDNKGGFGGKMREIISFDEYLSAASRLEIEGYLAHKWGLTAELPSDHPYKNDAP